MCLKLVHCRNHPASRAFRPTRLGIQMSEKDQRQQRDLFESERSFRLLVEGVADYALYMLDPTGIVTSWNIGAQRIKGYAPQEILGRHFSAFYTDTDRANGKPTRALRIARETGRYEEDGWRVRRDGTFFWASVVIDPIYEDGRLVGFAKITRDISERREAQLKLDQMQAQLAESQKLDALGQLTGGVAHDFNNLLMIVSGSLHTLRKGASDDPKMQRALAAIDGATKRGAALTSQLLTFARRQSVNPQTVDVTERIKTVRDVLHTGVGGTVTLQFDLDRSVWPVMVDITELETALVNLAINARDAMPDGGIIKVAAHNTGLSEEAHSGDYVAISVTDTGTGIAPDVLSKIFDPFFTTKPIGKGTGLGLSQVHGFVHQAGGTVRVASELGKGTKITILLPRQHGGLAVDDVSVTESSGSGTVLLVDDNPEVAAVSTSLLEQLGYTVRRVENAEAALREIERDGIDLVFTDIVMPGKMDGLGLARRLKAMRPQLPILLATGYSDAALNVRGDFPILRKPYEIHQLSQAIAKLPR
ncbi:PAS domain S-box protein [Bradyrhizobium sp. AUGA SZCCT0222]|nr:PAS domain S-box protein [Bradyrhizobium sp. AUGA SZCCT0222]